jgi:hypothetical protein
MALRIRHTHGMKVRKKRPRGFKEEAQGVQVSPLNPLSVAPWHRAVDDLVRHVLVVAVRDILSVSPGGFRQYKWTQFNGVYRTMKGEEGRERECVCMRRCVRVREGGGWRSVR